MPDQASFKEFTNHSSMRPEHGCSGNETLSVNIPAQLRASMRPEHGCSGNVGRRGSFRQAGKGFNEAGARMLRKCTFGSP